MTSVPPRLSDALRSELEQAIRGGLVEAESNELWARAGAILRRVEAVLVTETPTVEQVADAIQRDNGFMRVGAAEAMIDGKIVSADRLVSAQVLVARREYEGRGLTCCRA